MGQIHEIDKIAEIIRKKSDEVTENIKQISAGIIGILEVFWMLCCELVKVNTTRSELMKNYNVVKEYDPQPKNKDGSIRWFLYRWDDGKNGVRRLVRCKHCGCYFLIQAYHLNKFSKYANVQFEEWYPIKSEIEADYANATYTGLQWELEHRPVIRCEDDVIVCLGF